MKLKIRYYGLLTDVTHCEMEMIEKYGITTANLITFLQEKYPDFRRHSIVYFANGKKLEQTENISSIKEIDCMPPFAGG